MRRFLLGSKGGLLALVVLAFAAVQVGCGAGSKSQSSSSTQSTGTPAALLTPKQVEACLSGKGINFKPVQRAAGITNIQVAVSEPIGPITVHLNVFPSAEAASTYVDKVRETITASGADLQLHGNVMVATDGVVLPAYRPDVSPAEDCAKG